MLLVISQERNDLKDCQTVNHLFESGLQILHLRKPSMSVADMERWIENIKPKFRQRLVLHSNYEIIKSYKLKGVHFNKNTSSKDKINYREYLVSKACHSLNELADPDCEYVVFSPVFESISKPNYKPNYSRNEMVEVLQKKGSSKAIALGGINTATAALSLTMGFDGVACLGAIWNAPNPLKSFENIMKIIEN